MPATHFQSTAFITIGLFAALLLLYLLSGPSVIIADSVSNSYLPLSVLAEGNLSFTPDEVPFLFEWEMQGADGRRSSLLVSQITPTVAALRAEGALRPVRESYNLVPSQRDGLYVSQYGPGTGLTALPVVAVARTLVGDLMDRRRVLATVCRAVAAACVALSAVLVFLTARRFVATGPALVLTAAYAVGTSVWTTSSQSLVQHGPNELYLALGTYALARGIESRRWLAVSGLAYSAAVACRPTSGLVLLAVGVYLLVADRRGWLLYCAGCLPLLLCLAGYNAHYLGNPWTFGQTIQARLYQARQEGANGVWETPLLTGLTGLLVSPSRGLLVFSPWILLSLGGALAAWRRPQYGWLRPLTIAAAAIAVVQAKWFSWWGGWSFGCRPLVDTMPFVALCALPAFDWLRRSRVAQAAFALLLAWSVFVQALGALAYDMEGWNARRGYAVRSADGRSTTYTVSRREAEELAALLGTQAQPATLNIDFQPHTSRLWSLADNQIGYYLTHFRQAREQRRRADREGIWIIGQTPHLTHYNLGVGLGNVGRWDEAAGQYRAAIEANPDFDASYLNLGNIYAQRGQFELAAAEYRQAIRLAPATVAPRENLATVLSQLGRYSESNEQFEKCLELAARSPRTHYLFAESLAAQGADASAVEHYRQAVRWSPNWAAPRRGLAWVLATSADERVGNPREAWGLARELIAAGTAPDARVLDAAAAAAAALGRFDEAVRLAEASMKRSVSDGDSALGDAVGDRLQRYRRHERYVRRSGRPD